MQRLLLVLLGLSLLKNSMASPARGRALQQSNSSAPSPDFYFPLSDNSLVSLTPSNEYQAIPSAGVSWAADPLFGTVVSCNSAAQSYLTIPGVTYGQSGPFAVSFWAKPNIIAGNMYEYVYSHNATTTTNVSTSPNMVQMYYPELNHPNVGVLRVIVRDNSDVETNPTSPMFLDSDGCIANPSCAFPNTALQNVSTDNKWHMVTLTTHPGGGKGVSLYIDDQLAAETVPGLEYTDGSGGAHTATGGGPIQLNGALTLCARADLNPERFYSGSISRLSIFNSALDSEQVTALYNLVAQSPPGPVPAQNNATQQCVTPCALNNGVYMCTTPQGSSVSCGPSSVQAPTSPGASPSPSLPVARINGHTACAAQPVAGITTASSCDQGYTCVLLTMAQLQATVGAVAPSYVGNVGICAYAPDGVLLPDPSVVPPAMAFFPLNSPAIQSFPLGEYQSVVQGPPMVEPDPVFGGSIRCISENSDFVALDPVLYGSTTGAFAVNLWVRLGNMTSQAPLYAYSHEGIAASSSGGANGNSGWGPNQVQIYFPEIGHPAYGIGRTYVRDSNDFYTGPASEGYIDTDGYVAYDGTRSGPFPLLDGGWHMLTVTSQPSGGRGYVLYLDGVLASQINETTPVFDASGNQLAVDGGDVMYLSGNIVLCTRADEPAQRLFDGNLAYLSVWDQTLQPSQVEALYGAVQTKMTSLGSSAQNTSSMSTGTPALSTRQPAVQRYAQNGQPCQFPAMYDGQVITDCVQFGGAGTYCPVGTNQWEPCAGSQPAAPGAEVPLPSQMTSPSNYASAYQDYGSIPGMEGAVPSSASGEGLAQVGDQYRGIFYSADNQLCELPLMYSGIQIDNCVDIGGDQYCWTTGGAWAPCAPGALLQSPQPGTLGVGPTTVPVLTMQQVTRMTTDGELCDLPTVDQGEIIDDCVDLAGVLSCKSVSGQWKACDTTTPGGLQPQPEGTLYVANRITVTGEPCLFPAVYNGYLWFDCALYQAPNGSFFQSGTSICGTPNGTWDICAYDAGSSPSFTTEILNVNDVLSNRTVPGDVGQLCMVIPNDANHGCQEALTCVPMPPLENLTEIVEPLQGSGFCSQRPDGTTFGVFPTLEKENAPQPLAYFPLTGGNIDSLTLPSYQGTILGSSSPAWMNDSMFGSVAVCNATNQNAIQLSNVPYGVWGPLAINLWMRRTPGSSTSGVTFQYLFSHTSLGSTPGYSPNQVGIYLPDAGHPAYGLVRAILKDSTDSSTYLVFLDSDGMVDSNANRSTAARPHDVNDGSWHMITLTTLADGQPGYALFVDGVLGGALTQSSVQPDNTSVPEVTGGMPALMGSDIFLCARSDLSVTDVRYYDGAIANVMLFQEALDAPAIAALYGTYNPTVYESAADAPLVMSTSEGNPQALAAKDAGAFGANETSSYGYYSGGMSAGLIVGIVLASIGGAVGLAAVGILAVNGVRRRRQHGRFQRFEDPHDTYPPMTGVERGYGTNADGTLNIQLASANSDKFKPMESGTSYSSSVASLGPAAGLSPVSSMAAASPASNMPLGVRQGGPGSVASTMTDDVEIAPGRRTLFGKTGTRIVVPEHLEP